MPPVLDHTEVELLVLGQRECLPTVAVEKAPGEGHAGAEESTREAQGTFAEGPYRVDQAEGGETQAGARGGFGVGDHVIGLHRLGPGAQPSVETRQQVCGGPAVGVEEDDPIRVRALAAEAREPPVERAALPRPQSIFPL
jgi:hypothetical protein